MSAATESNNNNAPVASSNNDSEANAGGGGNANNAFHSASLYVGDLEPDVSESLLFDIFNAVGPVASIRVCRDAVTRRSLGYAYINFHQVHDAERALDTMNYTEIKGGRPCRIMWSQRDPSLRRSNVGNIFVKNLHESIDNKQLYDTFSLFGNILSCKVVCDPQTSLSKGYGYVHYETAEAAEAAIDKLDGMLIDGKEVNVGHFMRRNDRPGLHDWTNCFVKNIPTEWSDADLREQFEPFGEIVSAAIAMGTPKQQTKAKAEGANTDEPDEPEEEEATAEEKKDEKVNLGFGFVNFAQHESAVQAVEQLSGKKFDTKAADGTPSETELYVGRAQKKAERDRELRAKFEALKMERISKFQGINLYVKNLDDSITDDILRAEFAPFGTITSCRVMREGGRSRGFGFVCFTTPEEATRAVTEMNGKLFNNKPIFVALAQRKEVRKAQLEAQHLRTAQPMYSNYGPPARSMQPAYPMMQAPMPGRGGRGMPGRGPPPQMGYGMSPAQPGRGGMMQGRGMPGRGGRMMQGRGRGPPPPMQMLPQQQRQPQQQQPVLKFHQQQQQQQRQAPPESLTASALASASPDMQKNMIGERLYPLIHALQPELAGKITGMLLEMDNSELLHLLESPEALNAKIAEAMQVLEAHQAAQQAASS